MFNFRLIRIHKEGREESVCQPASISEHERKLKSSLTKPTSLMSKSEYLKMTFPTTSACKGAQHGFGTPPLSFVHVKVPKMTEKGVIKEITFFPHHFNCSFRNSCKCTVFPSAFLTNVIPVFYFRCHLIVNFLFFCWK